MKNILDLYDKEVRANPSSVPGLKVVRDSNVTKLEGVFNFVCSWDFSKELAQDVVREQAEYFRKQDKELMWRVFGHDKPSNLESSLKEEGFLPEPGGTLMALPLSREFSTHTELDIRRVSTSSELDDYLKVMKESFGNNNDGDFEYFLKLLKIPGFYLFTGYVNDDPVVAGRLEVPNGSCFGLLFGGGVMTKYRGQGFYRALVLTRAKMAIDLGLEYLSTEARETSRPILKKMGFIEIEKETTWILPVNR